MVSSHETRFIPYFAPKVMRGVKSEEARRSSLSGVTLTLLKT